MKKSKNILYSFKYAIEGFLSALKTERNMKIHIVLVILVSIAGFLFKISYTEWIVIILLFGMVIVAELINTAIETTVDIAMPKKNEKAKLAKDIAASAVLVCAIVAIVIGLIIFIPKLIS